MSDEETLPEGTTGGKTEEKAPFMERFKAFINEYGTIAIATWFAIFFGTWAAFAALLSAGLDLGGWMSEGEGSGWLWGLVKDWGPIGLAYVPTQLVKPFRAAATFAITPVVHKVLYGKLGPREKTDEKR